MIRHLPADGVGMAEVRSEYHRWKRLAPSLEVWNDTAVHRLESDNHFGDIKDCMEPIGHG